MCEQPEMMKSCLVTSLRHCDQSDGMLRETKTLPLQKIPLEMVKFTHYAIFIII